MALKTSAIKHTKYVAIAILVVEPPMLKKNIGRAVNKTTST
jgi:hypothetical protein